MVKIIWEVTHCNECPFSGSISRQVGLSTNNDYMLYWSCKKTDKKLGCYDFDENVEIPDFCPFKKGDLQEDENENPFLLEGEELENAMNVRKQGLKH